MRIIDLTHPFTASMPAYPGDPKSGLKQIASVSKDGYADHKLETTMHAGTHIDAPAHTIEDGKRIDELPLESFRGRGMCIDARERKEIDAVLLKDCEIKKGDVVLFCTGFSKRYRDKDYLTDFPVMTEALAEELAERRIKMVGMDTPSPDKIPYTVHKILLGAGILIMENLANLEAFLEIKDFFVEAFPLRLAADAAPARIVAVIR
ncbi:MAG: hypothetical protein A2W52_03020 [Candidatus Taylorbacteria bacterium RIFCSPHIGHO2_02_49_25]|uniref:Cyclase n=1 Tax=Candidatus Taylorbacteria bacterium RIFCSPHIGHO2_02_49_25 TaxID=1802305 RepID=A0A1G2MGD7_9BACT|nr:MAG: Cyclase [Parcubacteria group bacterium GW2011_GWF2_50_9]OHA22774.1 MAG: hypothetical protein A2W52_03020 [Candidatus Taylorbacteria bacterium RIFCSPHIGHO2_02_49_25]OHA35166.1 MAG: hypothetical protein A3B27_01165 [Candidatus Taylorbacteria bacterium RIFCSPLOWO2_01_FULL_50_130]OHA35545.1 MAG: hypothetical protein A2W65_00600 [Candidatus Taylorbacteria bacterium RIFCSPLOWO2_02_50_13]OHA40795.1 MAG: hypothetical protein A3H73_00350 [Candidatus Taylorbacteria bacterium RIFCSPLOWO2_02_FULL_5